jgi:hypothetical protein
MNTKENKVAFYEVLFTSALGRNHVQNVVGTKKQADDYAYKEAKSLGCDVAVTYVAGHDFNAIKNLCNND